MKKGLLYDVLRDRGSSKISTTKFFAFVFGLILICYVVYYLFWLKEDLDHTLIIEMFAFIGGLLGLKNGWGVVNKAPKNVDQADNQVLDHKNEVSVDDDEDDEAVF